MSAPILIGLDAEFSNFVAGDRGSSDWRAARLVHAHVYDEFDRTIAPRLEDRLLVSGRDSCDAGRRWLAAGSCLYIDSSHTEACTPLVRDAFDCAAAYHGLLGRVRAAVVRAQEELRPGETLVVSSDLTDRRNSAWGAHANFFICERCFHDILGDCPYLLTFFSVHLASLATLTGSGKLVREAGGAVFQKSQRADFFGRLTSLSTMGPDPRGICNLRDEALAEGGKRLHVIPLDNCVTPRGLLTKMGSLQLVLAMIHEGCHPLRILFRDPVEAFHVWSRDLHGNHPVRNAQGEMLTDVNVQRILCDEARKFVAEGLARGVVDHAERLVELWDETISICERGEALDKLDIDWALRYRYLERARDQEGLPWESPEMESRDVLFSAMLPGSPLWSILDEGLLGHYLDLERVRHLAHFPPESTREYFRGNMIRFLGTSGSGSQVVRVDWDRITIELPRTNGLPSRDVTFLLQDPLRHTEEESGHIFQSPEHFRRYLEHIRGFYD